MKTKNQSYINKILNQINLYAKYEIRNLQILKNIDLININQMHEEIKITEILISYTHIIEEYKNGRYKLKHEEAPLENTKKCLTENCLGRLIDNKCNICQIKFCKECEGTLMNQHECDKNILKSIQKINKDTKHCPNCNVRIYKIEGCYQM